MDSTIISISFGTNDALADAFIEWLHDNASLFEHRLFMRGLIDGDQDLFMSRDDDTITIEVKD